MAHQTSRLHRLLTLLDTGSTVMTRKTAAQQIGEIAKQHRGELQPLLKRVRHFLRSRNWDTRVAAAQATGAIAENVKHLTVKDLLVFAEAELLDDDPSCNLLEEFGDLDDESFGEASLTFRSFDLQGVLEYGGQLLSSGGQEYDVGVDKLKSPSERLAHQKQNLRRRLGLDGCEQFVDVNDMIQDEDLLGHSTSVGNGQASSGDFLQSKVNKQEVHELVANMGPGGLSRTLSARERNMLKRKAKVLPKDGLKEWGEDEEAEEPFSKRTRQAKSATTEQLSGQAEKFVVDVTLDDDHQEGEVDGGWPFGQFVDLLINDMLDPVWEVRHGSLMALREILSVQAASAGVIAPIPDSKSELANLPLHPEVELDLNREAEGELLIVKVERELGSDSLSNELWQQSGSTVCGKRSNSKALRAAKQAWASNVGFLQDCTIRLLCIFALDRFGDYVSDQVVAPVRETCAQVMGAMMKQMPRPLVIETLNILLQMQKRPEWEVRHGSLLGLKYLVAVRQEMLQDLLPQVLPACMAGLEDADDDVRAVAAEALTPAAAAIVATAGGKNITAILLSLWDILLDLDDLSPSTSSVMHLLAELYAQPEVDKRMIVVKPTMLDLNKTMVDELTGGNSQASGAEEDPFQLSTLAPRLWPFMRHNISSVRLAAIRTLERLLKSGDQRAKEKAQSSWAVPILGDALRMVFQNLLLESDENVIQCSESVWRLLLLCPEANLAEEATTYLSSWLKLASTATGSPLETSKMYSPNSLPRKSRGKAVAKLKAGHGVVSGNLESTLPLPPRSCKSREHPSVIVGADGEKSVVIMRVTASRALGVLAASLPSTMSPTIVNLLSELFSTPYGTQRQVASMVIMSWFKEVRGRLDIERIADAAKAVQPILHDILELLACGDPAVPTPGSNLPYGELSRMFAKMRTEASAFIKHTETLGTLGHTSIPAIDTISAEAAVDVATKLFSPVHGYGSDADDKLNASSDAMESARQRLLATAGYLQAVQGNLHMSVLASLAGAVVWIGELPVKLNPIIQPLMTAIKREQEELLQLLAAEALAEVLVQCVKRKPSPNEKLIKNLCALTCADVVETPKATPANAVSVIIDDVETAASGKSIKHIRLPPMSPSEERARLEGAITKRGAELVLRSLSEKLGDLLLDRLPKLWDCLTEALGHSSAIIAEVSQPNGPLPVLTADSQALVTNLQVVRSLVAVVDSKLYPRMMTLLPAIITCVRHDHAAVRLVASRCITAMAQMMTGPVMAVVLTTAVPMLGDVMSLEARQGAGMLITALVEGLGTELVAYAPFLIVPLLRCMSDPNHLVRRSVTKSFAALVPLLPLARGVPPPQGLDECQASRSADDTRFLEQLLDNSQIDDYKLLVPINVSLRRYQQEGINWLAFLKRFKLHGILCDDMGLGKTLQASAIIASDAAEQANAYISSKSSDMAPLPSLVVCPSTLVGHWAYEIEKFIPTDFLNPLQYLGSPQERINLRTRFSKHNIIITSYDVLRKDVDILAEQVWNYCILDEGHIIKNAKSKITLAAKRIKAEHRLILSGTPIQNNVLELWSLFDFLMPGFLGSERQFQCNYGKPLVAAREAKCSAKDAEAGVFAMEALHKQVMPFLLRRTKEEVLSDLPPKIIQDRYCDLSPLQLRLYENFSQSQAKTEISTFVQKFEVPGVPEASATCSAPSTHVFQALQYLRKLCSHPLLVLGDEGQEPGHANVIAQIGSKDLHELQHSPKLLALRDILEECGIGMPLTATTEAPVGENGQHRVLVFAQLKSFLDIIEKDLLQTLMKGVTYLRLDGSVESEKRFDIVRAFNSDPTIDVLLLTTHVGGLGLNLTAADTVVFMEHDWNPMRDLQAMDRAHRLGQQRAVNVYRLIMRGTLEEKIMSLQRFKMSVANTVINADNSSLNTMDTAQLLDLFTMSTSPGKAGVAKNNLEDEGDSEGLAASGGASKGLKAILNNLEELWDQSQYTEEYNLTQFVARLNG